MEFFCFGFNRVIESRKDHIGRRYTHFQTEITNLIRNEMNGCIRGLVEKLPENYRTVVVLSELEGFRDDEIAEILGGKCSYN